ncbi:MAG: GyrI-like domain-containing protein [Bacteroidetes bacterium]|nr:GyrI-like domain-containing protein [Bacteroidota bacterium]MBU1680466.1 GyrI-like domain-containing protein [Bacteroidota bacterium]MBU2505869.1 GyrI-like domain-containing protein [Bacteroidota bacterium]
MSEKVEIVERELTYTLEVNENAQMWKLPKIIGQSYRSIMDYSSKKNNEITEAPFVRYLNINWEEMEKDSKIVMFMKMFSRKWNMLIGFPLNNKLDGEGKIEAGMIPAGRYLKSMHRGPYQKVGDTYKAMQSFGKKESLQFKGESIEFYLNDPQITKKEDLETIVLIPLK